MAARRGRAGGRQNSPAVPGRAGPEAGWSSAAASRAGGPGPGSRVRMAAAAAAGSRPHLGSASGHAPLTPAPRNPAPGGRTPGLPWDPDGCAFVPATQAISLQVDMAMALQRVRISDKYGKSYLCLLQAVFLAGKFPPRARRPAASASRRARAPLSSRAPSPAARLPSTLCLPFARTRSPSPAASALGRPAVVPPAPGRAAGGP